MKKVNKKAIRDEAKSTKNFGKRFLIGELNNTIFFVVSRAIKNGLAFATVLKKEGIISRGIAIPEKNAKRIINNKQEIIAVSSFRVM